MQPRGRPGPSTQASSIPNGYTPQQHDALVQAAEDSTGDQLICALDYVVNLLKQNGIAYAGMGGLALNLRGSERETHDVDTSASCDMSTLRNICKGRSRLKMPLGPTAGVMRVFVEVGPKHNENVSEAWVQVDIILLGSLGAPDDLLDRTETITVQTPMGERQYVVLDVLRHFESKLGAFFSRNGRSDYLDLVFICNKYASEIAGFRSQLSLPHRQHFIESFASINQGYAAASRVKRMKSLLGVP